MFPIALRGKETASLKSVSSVGDQQHNNGLEKLGSKRSYSLLSSSSGSSYLPRLRSDQSILHDSRNSQHSVVNSHNSNSNRRGLSFFIGWNKRPKLAYNGVEGWLGEITFQTPTKQLKKKIRYLTLSIWNSGQNNAIDPEISFVPYQVGSLSGYGRHFIYNDIAGPDYSILKTITDEPDEDELVKIILSKGNKIRAIRSETFRDFLLGFAIEDGTKYYSGYEFDIGSVIELNDVKVHLHDSRPKTIVKKLIIEARTWDDIGLVGISDDQAKSKLHPHYHYPKHELNVSE